MHAGRADAASRRAHERVDRTFAPIGEGHLIELRVGQDAPEAARDRGRDCDRIDAPFEGLRRDDDPVRNAAERKRVDGAWPRTEIDWRRDPRFPGERRRLYSARTGRARAGLVRAFRLASAPQHLPHPRMDRSRPRPRAHGADHGRGR